jgi:hypothetical protein
MNQVKLKRKKNRWIFWYHYVRQTWRVPAPVRWRQVGGSSVVDRIGYERRRFLFVCRSLIENNPLHLCGPISVTVKWSVIIRQTFGMMRQREFLRRAASVSADYVCVSYCHVILSIIRESILTVWTRYRSHPKVRGRAQHAHHHYHFDRPVTCSYSNESIRAKKCFQVIGGTFASPFPNFFDKAASRTVNVVPIMTKFTLDLRESSFFFEKLENLAKIE